MFITENIFFVYMFKKVRKATNKLQNDKVNKMGLNESGSAIENKINYSEYFWS